MAKGSATIAVKSTDWGREVTVALTSDASGDCDQGTFTAWGTLVAMVVIPDATADPTDAFDLTMKDDEDASLDILGGAGANMSNRAGMTAGEKYITLAGPNTDKLRFFGNEVTLVGDNMGNAKIAVVRLQFLYGI